MAVKAINGADLNNISEVDGRYNVLNKVNGVDADLTPPAAAYSVRNVSGLTGVPYDGPAMRILVDATGDGADATDLEFDINFTADGDLDVADIELKCTGGKDAYVVKWYDQSGAGNDAVQTAYANMPKIATAGVVILENGKPALDFSDISQLTTPFDTSSSAFDLPQTMVLVTRYVSGGSFQDYNFMVSGGGGSAFGKFEMYGRPADGTYAQLRIGQGPGSAAFAKTSSFTSTDMYLHSGIWGSSNMKMSYNGGSVITGAATNSNDHTTTTLALGAVSSNISGAFRTPEFIIWPTDQDSDGNLSGINTNTNTYFSIT